MPLHLKGNSPRPGEPDRRYYMIDVQVDVRRVRISSGTRDHALATRKMQQVVDALRVDPQVPKETLLALLRGEVKAAAISRRNYSGPTFGSVGEMVKEHVWRGSDDYKHTVGNFAQVEALLGADTAITAINTAMLDDLVSKLRKGVNGKRGNAPATINRKLSIVSTVLDFAYAREFIRHKPTIPRQPGERKRTFTFDEKEFERMVAAIRQRDEREDGPQGGRPVKRDASWYARFYEFLYESGVRPGEALQLPWANIDMESGHIAVKHDVSAGTRTKTDRSRVVPITTRCRELLLEVWGQVRGGPFKNLTYDRAHWHWEGAKKALGIEHKDCVPYATRHSLATRLIESTGDLHLTKEWLGHSTITLTSDTYGHVRSKYMNKGADALNDRRRSISESSESRDRVSPEDDSSPAASEDKPRAIN